MLLVELPQSCSKHSICYQQRKTVVIMDCLKTIRPGLVEQVITEQEDILRGFCGLVQDYSNSYALLMEMLKSCASHQYKIQLIAVIWNCGCLVTLFCYQLMLFHTTMQWQQQNINQVLNSQKTPHTSSSWASFVVSVVRIWKNLSCYNDTALYQCTSYCPGK